MALEQHVEKVGKQVVVVYKTLVLLHVKDWDCTGAIEKAEMLCQKTYIR